MSNIYIFCMVGTNQCFASCSRQKFLDKPKGISKEISKVLCQTVIIREVILFHNHCFLKAIILLQKLFQPILKKQHHHHQRYRHDCASFGFQNKSKKWSTKSLNDSCFIFPRNSKSSKTSYRNSFALKTTQPLNSYFKPIVILFKQILSRLNQGCRTMIN